jgi:uncharacterized protein (TIGR03792 family)
MKIEKLTFQVRPSELSQEFISQDRKIWDPWLKRQPGYLNKTFRVTPRNGHSEVIVLILWKGEKELKSASLKEKEISLLDRKLRTVFPGTFSLVHSKTI